MVFEQGSDRSEAIVQQGFALLASDLCCHRRSPLANSHLVAWQALSKAYLPSDRSGRDAQRSPRHAACNWCQLRQLPACRLHLP